VETVESEEEVDKFGTNLLWLSPE